MEASDCFLYFLPEELREFEVFFSLLPFREVRRSAAFGDVGGNLFFWSRGVSQRDRQSGQVCLFV